jgi:hypothetical protein
VAATPYAAVHSECLLIAPSFDLCSALIAIHFWCLQFAGSGNLRQMPQQNLWRLHGSGRLDDFAIEPVTTVRIPSVLPLLPSAVAHSSDLVGVNGTKPWQTSG